jgi:hypothetical protein
MLACYYNNGKEFYWYQIGKHGAVKAGRHQAEGRLVAQHERFCDGHQAVETLLQRRRVLLKHHVGLSSTYFFFVSDALAK